MLDNLCTGFKANLSSIAKDVEFIEGDVADEAAVARAMAGIELVYHEAALASVPMSVEKPLATNHACVTGTVNVLHQAVKAGVKRVVYAASSSAYGDRPYSAKRETDLHKCSVLTRPPNLPASCICKPFTIASFGNRRPALLQRVRPTPGSGQSLLGSDSIVRHPLARRSTPHRLWRWWSIARLHFCWQRCARQFVGGEVEGIGGQIMNLADGRRTTLLQLLELLAKYLGVPANPDFHPPRIGDVREKPCDISLARKLLGYEPPPRSSKACHKPSTTIAPSPADPGSQAPPRNALTAGHAHYAAGRQCQQPQFLAKLLVTPFLCSSAPLRFNTVC